MDLSNLIPISAVVAVCLFALKERLEAGRRKKGDRRKISALKTLIARECELNLWTLKQYKRISDSLKKEAEIEEEDERGSFTVVEKSSGKLFFRSLRPDGSEGGELWMPNVHRDVLSKYLLDIATLDSGFYRVAETAYDALAEVQHVQDSIRQRQERPSFISPSDFDYSLALHSVEELEEANNCLDALYFYCTGEKLTSHRLR